ncbi:thioredoxin domain-containing protein 16 [Pogona vitticeps]
MRSLQRNGGPFLLFLFVLVWTSYLSTASGRKEAAVPELSSEEYFGSLEASKASLVYFRKDASPSAEVFLEQLENAIEPLQDYGISVLKVNCHKGGKTPGYCREESSVGKAYLFRGRILLRELPTDALFSVDAIVANVLFALLFNEVKYVMTLVDLQNLEDSLKGQRDLVFAYVQAVGTAEHRALMETAFVYGAFKFALTTEVTLLRSISPGESDVPSSRLFFCHCKADPDLGQPCRRTPMEPMMTTLNIYKFLKLMGQPLVMEVAEDPEKFSPLHLQLGLPLIFVLSREETLEADKKTAESVAWRLLGKAGVFLLSRTSLGGDVPPQNNVAIKTPEEGASVKYLVLKDTDEIIALVEMRKESELVQEEEEEDYEEEEEEEEDNEQEIQDDQVVESVIRDQKRELFLGRIQTLTGESFDLTLADASYTLVLFYASWEAVSLVVMQTYAEVAASLKDPEISLARVNCWDWPKLCTQQNVTQFPTLKMYAKEGRWLVYTGMWGTEEILKFVELSRTACPMRLKTPEEVEEYLRVKSSPYRSAVVLGLFDFSMKEAKEAFTEVARVLNGDVMMGIYCEEDATILSQNYNLPLPGLVLVKSETQKRHHISLSEYSPGHIIESIRRGLLDVFPEITVGNLPAYFQRAKPLLMLYSDGPLGERVAGEMRRVAEGEHREDFVACWLNLKNTPVGWGILKAYFGSPLPPLPLLLWINLHSGGEVFVFPSDRSLSEPNILAWVKKLESGQEALGATLSGEEWRPRLPAYDFLRKMAPTLPEFTIYSGGSIRSHREELEVSRGNQARAPTKKGPTEGGATEAEAEKEPPRGGDLRGTAPRLGVREKQTKRHAEL